MNPTKLGSKRLAISFRSRSASAVSARGGTPRVGGDGLRSRRGASRSRSTFSRTRDGALSGGPTAVRNSRARCWCRTPRSLRAAVASGSSGRSRRRACRSSGPAHVEDGAAEAPQERDRVREGARRLRRAVEHVPERRLQLLRAPGPDEQDRDEEDGLEEIPLHPHQRGERVLPRAPAEEHERRVTRGDGVLERAPAAPHARDPAEEPVESLRRSERRQPEPPEEPAQVQEVEQPRRPHDEHEAAARGERLELAAGVARDAHRLEPAREKRARWLGRGEGADACGAAGGLLAGR